LSIAYPQLQFLIFCAPSDFRQANRIAEGSGTNVSVIPSGLSLMQAVALLAEVDCVLTPDTSIVHIAASLRIPLVAMYTAAETNYRRRRRPIIDAGDRSLPRAGWCVPRQTIRCMG
jgi:ADP-heptose:LPS heptosyltransferase